MTGGQNYVLFWTLKPNLSSRFGKRNVKLAEEGKAPESNEGVVSATENVMRETFTSGVSVGKIHLSNIAVTGTSSGAFAVWENFECIKLVPGVHGMYHLDTQTSTLSGIKRAIPAAVRSCKIIVVPLRYIMHYLVG